jgi:hypothetical protein
MLINRGVNPSAIWRNNMEQPLNEIETQIHNNEIVYLLLEKVYPIRFAITGMFVCLFVICFLFICFIVLFFERKLKHKYIIMKYFIYGWKKFILYDSLLLVCVYVSVCMHVLLWFFFFFFFE